MRKLALATLVALALSLVLTAALAAASPIRFFQTSDGNIGCAVFAGRKHIIHGNARCDIGNRSWPVPPRPKSCPYDYGNGLEVGVRSMGHFTCAGDTILHQGGMVAVGTVITKGRFTCTVLSNGVRCVNRRTRHGFELSAAQPLIF